jgi:hypothetical protein
MAHPEIITNDLLAKVAEAIPCDCDTSPSITGVPHRVWCARMTPSRVLRLILEAAIPHFSAETDRAVTAATEEATAAERERIANLVTGYRCPCGEEDCADVAADIASLIREEAEHG